MLEELVVGKSSEELDAIIAAAEAEKAASLARGL